MPVALSAQEPTQPQEPKPATQEAQPSAKTPPDAFHYFFGKEDKKDSKDGKDSKKEPEAKAAAPAKKAEPAVVKAAPASKPAPEAPVPIAAPVAPAAEVPAAPAAAPALAVPKPQPQPAVEESAKPALRVDALQYFSAKSSQPALRPEAKKAEPAEKKPVDAFDYLFRAGEGFCQAAGRVNHRVPKPVRLVLQQGSQSQTAVPVRVPQWSMWPLQ